MKFDLSKIELSHRDVSKGISFPNKLTLDLSELLGIIVGDGHLFQKERMSKKGNKSVTSSLIIAGNCEEIEHLDYINSLFTNIFGFNLKRRKDKRSKSLDLLAHSNALVIFLNKSCGIHVGRKSHCCNIPKIIKVAPTEYKLAFLRGLADTDFTVSFKKNNRKSHSYPVIRASFRSKELVKDLEEIYKNIGFVYSTLYDYKRYDNRFDKTYIHNEIYLYGKNNFHKWLNLIGFSHPKFQRRIKKWLEDGECPPGY